jgi:hypothetical protein
MEIKVCPSCGSTEIMVAGNKVHCAGCDVSFQITAEGAKVLDVDPLGKNRKRLDQLERDIEELKRGKGITNEPANQPAKEGDEIDEEDDGFIDFSADKPGQANNDED